MSEFFLKAQHIAGMMRQSKTKVIRFSLPYIGKRKRTQIRACRKRI